MSACDILFLHQNAQASYGRSSSKVQGNGQPCCCLSAHGGHVPGIQLGCGAWLQRPDMDLAEELAAEAEWAEADDHQGPHCLIRQPEMRLFWRRCFGRQEEVTWDAFWARFPKDVSRRA